MHSNIYYLDTDVNLSSIHSQINKLPLQTNIENKMAWHIQQMCLWLVQLILLSLQIHNAEMPIQQFFISQGEEIEM